MQSIHARLYNVFAWDREDRPSRGYSLTFPIKVFPPVAGVDRSSGPCLATNVWDVSGRPQLCSLCSLQWEARFVFVVIKQNLILAATVLEGTGDL